MTPSFPFGFGAPTTVYLLLYLVTWIAHVILVGAVLGGSLLCAVRIFRGQTELSERLGASLPLLLGLAITAGVAPLLFVQILYRDAFYTANLLLYVRFLAILPALITCFYLLYFARTKRASSWRPGWRAAIYLVAGLLALFIGVSWAELHTMGIEPENWTAVYAAGEHSNFSLATALRSLAFLSMAFPLTAVVAVALFSLRGQPTHAPATLGALASVGTLASMAMMGLYARSLSAEIIDALLADSVRVHLLALGALGVVSASMWAAIHVKGEATAAIRKLLYAVMVAMLWCLAVVREAIRATSVDLGSLDQLHRQAWNTGGQLAFAVFALVNIAAIVWCTRLVAKVWRGQAESAASLPEDE